MNRNSKILVSVSVLLISIFLFIIYGTDVCRYYKNASAANAPTLPIGSRMLVSSLVKPKRLDFVAFKLGDSLFGKGKIIQRLVGIPGDTLEIKNGSLHINGNDVDNALNLAHKYRIPLKISEVIKQDLLDMYMYDGVPYYPDNNTVTLFIPKNIATKNNLENYRLIENKDNFDRDIFSVYNQKWNKDNFGPLILKETEYFVLGDNRDNSHDSRYSGTVLQEQIIGKAIRF
ncbi:signal peptidase I [uncultured Aquimarina sp.]|uniref:signal peptidase I n=1 Tax=uncultured Aquimarina sp. TaxID=575652 RepID=UPI0026080DF3|nr:signal peptidase I [uncultured Aquimarina sp.]